VEANEKFALLAAVNRELKHNFLLVYIYLSQDAGQIGAGGSAIKKFAASIYHKLLRPRSILETQKAGEGLPPLGMMGSARFS